MDMSKHFEYYESSTSAFGYRFITLRGEINDCIGAISMANCVDHMVEMPCICRCSSCTQDRYMHVCTFSMHTCTVCTYPLSIFKIL